MVLVEHKINLSVSSRMIDKDVRGDFTLYSITH